MATSFLNLFRALTIDGLQIAGGINESNAQVWIDRGASKVIVTSYLFPEAKFSLERLIEMEKIVGKERLVVDVRLLSQQSLSDFQLSKAGRRVVCRDESMADHHQHGSQ